MIKLFKKEILIICPECKTTIKFKNWFDWILHTPFHWFRKRKVKCPECGARGYVARMRG